MLNGIGEPGLATDLSAALERIGFTTATPGDTTEPATGTAIYHAPGDEAAAVLLARHVTGSALFGVDEDLTAGEVVLVAGPDFTTLHEQPSPTVPQLPSSTTVDGEDASTTSTTTTTQVGYVPEDAPGAACS